jgi:hypothetical protein
MSDMNHVFLIGHIMNDAAGRTLTNGIFQAKFSIAMKGMEKDNEGEWKENEDSFDFALYGESCREVFPQLTKGRHVAVGGYLRQGKGSLQLSLRDIQFIGRYPFKKASDIPPMIDIDGEIDLGDSEREA